MSFFPIMTYLAMTLIFLVLVLPVMSFAELLDGVMNPLLDSETYNRTCSKMNVPILFFWGLRVVWMEP
jgi:hypothetical protein